MDSPEKTSHRVAIVVLCEANGVDESDASAVATAALSRLVREHRIEGAETDVASTMDPSCSGCGSRPGVYADGAIAAHATGENWIADENDAEHLCEGTRQPPRISQHPVIGFDRADGTKFRVRVNEVMDAGVAAGNGYLWLEPTTKAFRY